MCESFKIPRRAIDLIKEAVAMCEPVQPAAAESERDLQAIVEAVEDAVGHSHFGWDMVKPSEIVAAVLKHAATPEPAAAAARDIQAMAAMRKYEMTITGYRFVERYKWIISNVIGIYHDDPADAILALAAELEKGAK